MTSESSLGDRRAFERDFTTTPTQNNQNKLVAAAIQDHSVGFDYNMPEELLLTKLQNPFFFVTRLSFIIKNFLIKIKRMQQVVVPSISSDWKTLNGCVAQGTRLGILFCSKNF